MILAILTIALNLYAQPTTISYQGKYLDGSNMPVTQMGVTVNFAIYDASSGGTKIWPPSNPSCIKTLDINAGLYSATLGTGVGTDELFTTAMFLATPRYLEVTVDGNTFPRIELTSVPTSIVASQLSASGWASPGAIGSTTANTGAFTTLTATNNGSSTIFTAQNTNAANVSTTGQITTNGIGSGLSISLTNSSNGGRGLDVLQAGVGPGVFATSAGGNAVWGITSSISAAGVIGDNTFGEAVVGRNRGGNGVGAVVGRNDSSGYGVRGFNTKNGIGVLGQAGISGGTGVGGRFENVNASNTSDVLQVVTNSTGNAASFTGDVVITGDLSVSGTVAKGGGSFLIDHPLDPENKLLYHSFVESPDMKNIYDGVVILDRNGEGWVEMPNWFEALNRDFRYFLTPIGASAPGLYISQELANNKFKISGGKPNMKVSWQITGIRHDPFAEKHRIQIEVDKKPENRGTYIHPDVYTK